jgi:hypothetical protein
MSESNTSDTQKAADGSNSANSGNVVSQANCAGAGNGVDSELTNDDRLSILFKQATMAQARRFAELSVTGGYHNAGNGSLGDLLRALPLEWFQGHLEDPNSEFMCQLNSRLVDCVRTQLVDYALEQLRSGLTEYSLVKSGGLDLPSDLGELHLASNDGLLLFALKQQQLLPLLLAPSKHGSCVRGRTGISIRVFSGRIKFGMPYPPAEPETVWLLYQK